MLGTLFLKTSLYADGSGVIHGITVLCRKSEAVESCTARFLKKIRRATAQGVSDHQHELLKVISQQ